MALGFEYDVEIPRGRLLIGSVIFLLIVNEIYKRHKNPSRIPYENGRKWYEIGTGKAFERFTADPGGLVQSGLEKYQRAFYLFTDLGFQLVLSPSYSDVLRNDDRLHLGKALGEDFMADVPGFGPMALTAADDKIVPKAVKMMTRSLGNLIKPLVSEAEHALERNWTNSSDWHQPPLGSSLCRIVAQVESRILLNDDLCRDPAWLNIVEEISVAMPLAARHLRPWPAFLRSKISWFLPSFHSLQAKLQKVNEILKPLLDRAQARGTMLSQEKKPDGARREFSTVEWFFDALNGSPSGIGAAQIAITVPSLDAMAMAISNVLCDLSTRPDLIQALRSEIIEVIGKEGLTKPSLQKLELMDSVLKESQRMTPVSYISMQRKALEKIVLPDGLIIPKGTYLMVGATHMRSPSVWPDGENFDGYRFLKLRQNSKEASYLYTQTSSKHMGFGHGKQACPGRFFAECQIKVIMVNILLKYEFKITVPKEGRNIMFGHHIAPHPNIEIDVRRRQEEITF
ncbi:cytochrome P450 [Penicillium angulare]|uniref:cytochrome P450 n=1 Tax=Penicillium angulare TaxID=116970 RepID=UPI00254245A4|nr:cytochrome P450 [Penicillium angulare]KAJ5289176.1 cytochrome P450 [Penicillium angulare]